MIKNVIVALSVILVGSLMVTSEIVIAKEKKESHHVAKHTDAQPLLAAVKPSDDMMNSPADSNDNAVIQGENDEDGSNTDNDNSDNSTQVNNDSNE